MKITERQQLEGQAYNAALDEILLAFGRNACMNSRPGFRRITPGFAKPFNSMFYLIR